MKIFRGTLNQYTVFIGTVVFTIVCNQVIIQYALNKQNQDAYLINTAGRQRMLSQRISKFALDIQQDFCKNIAISPGQLDSLSFYSEQWKNVHFALLEEPHSLAIDSLLTTNTSRVENIYNACKPVSENPTENNITNAIAIIESEGLPFLFTMDKTVMRYEREAEQKLSSIKNIEILLAVTSIALLILVFVFIFLPVLKRLRQGNTNLTKLSSDLLSTNNELRFSQEEIRSNLEHIHGLQKHLEARENQFRKMVEDANDLMYELNENGKFTYINPVMETTCEFTTREFLQKYYWDFIHPDQKQYVIEFYKKQRNQLQEISYLEFCIISKTKKELWIGQNVRMTFEGKWVTKVNVIARQITELVVGRELLKQSEEKIKTLEKFAPVGIFQTDKSGSYTHVNKHWTEITGIDETSAIGKGWVKSIHPDDYQRVVKAWNDVVDHKIELRDEYRIKGDKEEIKRVQCQLAPIVDSQGNISCFLGTLYDITTVKTAQQDFIEEKNSPA